MNSWETAERAQRSFTGALIRRNRLESKVVNFIFYTRTSKTGTVINTSNVQAK